MVQTLSIHNASRSPAMPRFNTRWVELPATTEADRKAFTEKLPECLKNAKTTRNETETAEKTCDGYF